MSKLHALTVPKWGMSMEEGDITEWRIAVGDTISAGDEYVDIETSKIVNTAESSCTGTLVRIIAQPGETHQVGQLMGVVAEGDSTEEEIDAFVAAFVPDAGNSALAKSSVTDGSSAAAPTAATVAPLLSV